MLHQTESLNRRPSRVRCCFLFLTLFLAAQAINRQSAGDQGTSSPCDKSVAKSSDKSSSTIIPEDPDLALEHWRGKRKHLLVVAANKSLAQNSDLVFAKVDGSYIADKLQRRDYEVHEVITAEKATKSYTVHALQNLGGSETDLVMVYYSGHGAKDSDDLWLQLYEPYIGDGQGISVDELVTNIRKGYEGTLIIVIDSCYSGTATLNALSARKLANTIVITSSSAIEQSAIMKLPDGTEASAFSYFLTQALSADWENADSDSDGILEVTELVDYLKLRLACAFLERQISIRMSPRLFPNSEERFVAYDPSKVRNWNSRTRKLLKTDALNAELYGELRRREKIATRKSRLNFPVSERAHRLARITTVIDDPATKGLKDIAEGRFNSAIATLSAAEESSPGNLDKVYLALGLAQRYAGTHAAAINSYDRGLAVNNTSAELMREKAFALYAVKKYRESQDVFLQSVAAAVNEHAIDNSATEDAISDFTALLRRNRRMGQANTVETRASAMLNSETWAANPGGPRAKPPASMKARKAAKLF